jgi:molybdate transport system ATP-binding protein
MSRPGTAELQASLRLASRHLDVALSAPAGQTVALIGPNGVGKSTTLQVIAGLLRPDSGHVQLRDRVLLDTRRRLNVPAHKRRIALMSQSPLLFDSMSVLENVAYGPRSRGESRAHARAIAQDWLRRVKATDLAGRRPNELSGGQAQRVSLARTLASEPDLMVLDEPTSALDVTIAADTRQLLRQQLAGRTCLLVTHDPLDVLALASRVVILEGGRVAESGAVTEVLRRPHSRFGARFAGANLLEGTLIGPDALRCGRLLVRGHTDGADRTDHGPAHAVFPPDCVRIELSNPLLSHPTSTTNAWPATVHQLSVRRGALQVKAESSGNEFTALVSSVAAGPLALVPGQEVWLAVEPDDVIIHAD